MRRLLRLWPGYTGIVRYGRWSFLAVAVVFALVLNTLLVLNFAWTDYITTTQRNVLILAFLALWAALHAVSAQAAKKIEATRNADATSDGFREALLQYLRGNWFEAQCCLNILLKKNPRDVEAILMLATLHRHTKRFADAADVLEKLDVLEEADRWAVEIAEEKRLLESPGNETHDNPGTTARMP
ncbi:MAG TPA: hypothetical protein DEB39_00635 [Planctomycetaceae bacterium]|nr:hypothetical protein [Planctomycetaceae bacterium]